jgi:hypothetical protein
MGAGGPSYQHVKILLKKPEFEDIFIGKDLSVAGRVTVLLQGRSSVDDLKIRVHPTRPLR